ncbi:MAG: hypothetical protein AVDCRST_MAG17-1273 [uncultured Solirubrobacterales bacterium]|uniref:Uncharacterized protein n=1 Tax=uncultured Solirubrobacterales bacterium TaxID=768556 RepID=A0A6J4SHC6_9ACTN|nr:MAG: hypothetical protein AVDCRST_MAG17-1273 [uncultured Solirubrobacterales bacterium]
MRIDERVPDEDHFVRPMISRGCAVTNETVDRPVGR